MGFLFLGGEEDEKGLSYNNVCVANPFLQFSSIGFEVNKLIMVEEYFKTTLIISIWDGSGRIK